MPKTFMGVAWTELMWVYVAIAALVALFHVPSLITAYGQDDHGLSHRPTAQHERYHDYYKTWQRPDMPGSCCNATEYAVEGTIHISGDCEPSDAELRRDEKGVPHWYAKLPRYALGRGLGVEGSDWIKIPDVKIIQERNPSYEEGHLCWTEMSGVICFVPPDTGI